jgi:hypothetical protein
VALGSFTHGALAELSPDDLDRMLGLDETLFVEHKTDLGKDTAHEVIRAVAAFANTVGGWLLIGVTNCKPNRMASRWADPENPPTLVDAVRDRLRHEIDPLPAFEAKVIEHPEGPVGVVYESSDTPHVVLRSGSVFVREVAAVGDATAPKRSGSGRHRERAYVVAVIRSRAQLLELAERGNRASERVGGLLAPFSPIPLTTTGLGLTFELAGEGVIQPRHNDRASIVVKLAPYTLPARFRQWATTSEGSAQVLKAAENLADVHGLSPDHVQPDPAGTMVVLPRAADPRHIDDFSKKLHTVYRLVVDGAGVAGAALELAIPDGGTDISRRVQLEDLAREYVRPVINAAADILTDGEFLGRARCQIDIVRLNTALRILQQPRAAQVWVPTGADLALPATEDEIGAIALRAAYAYGRSAGLRAFDPPVGTLWRGCRIAREGACRRDLGDRRSREVRCRARRSL